MRQFALVASAVIFAILVGTLQLPTADGSAIAAAVGGGSIVLLAGAAGLCWLRLKRSSSLVDLIALMGSCVLLLGWVATLLLAPIVSSAAERLLAIAPLCELTAACCAVAAAVAPAARRVSRRRALTAPYASLAVVALLIAISAAMAFGMRAPSPGGARPFTLDALSGGGAARVVVIAALLLFAGAALLTVRRARAHSHSSLVWLSGGLGLLAAADAYRLVSGLTASSLGSGGDIARLTGCALILSAAVRLELAAQSRAARCVALAERQRIAGDLHDGIAQDLAFIAANGARLGELGEAMAAAADRALALSRGVIQDLSDVSEIPAQEALQALCMELGERFEINTTVTCDPGLELDPDVTRDVVRITREAIANAARHGRATHVMVSLQQRQGDIRLSICDDGNGLDGIIAPEGFGLASMRSRAAMLGGQLSVGATGAGHTEIVVSWR